MKKHLLAIAVLICVGAGCATDTPAVSPETEETSASEGMDVAASDKLDLSGQGLTALPSSALSKTGLQGLDISDNRIGGALPSEIGRLVSLRTLDASGNVMTGVPAEIGRLSELRILDLSDNRLTGLPRELANLKNLERLDLRGNDVSSQDLEIIRAGLPRTEILTD